MRTPKARPTQSLTPWVRKKALCPRSCWIVKSRFMNPVFGHGKPPTREATMGEVYRVRGAKLGNAYLLAESEGEAIKVVADTFKLDEGALKATR
jgi:hypothetical protein